MDRLRFSDLNPRLPLTRAQERDLTASLRLTEYGLVEGLVVNRRKGREGIVVGGNQRLALARKLGWTEVPVVWVDLDLEAERELNLRLNKNQGSWDMELLAEFDRSLLERVGFTQAELSSLLDVKEDDSVDLTLPEEPETKPGELFRLGDHLLLCGDSTDRESYRRLLVAAGALPSMVFTDPPYGISYVGGTAEKLTIKGDADLSAYERSLPLWPVRPGGAVYVCCPSTHSHLFVEIFRRRFYFSQKLIWVKDSATLGRQDYQWRHEEILFGSAEASDPGESYPEAHEELVYGWEKGRHLFHANRKQTTVWEFKKPKRSADHPTMKPVPLVARAVYNSSASGEIVLDPFSGSGSTLEACEHLGRRSIGLELDPRYCDVILRRWEALSGGKVERL